MNLIRLRNYREGANKKRAVIITNFPFRSLVFPLSDPKVPHFTQNLHSVPWFIVIFKPYKELFLLNHLPREFVNS